MQEIKQFLWKRFVNKLLFYSLTQKPGKPKLGIVSLLGYSLLSQS